jgi:hypothetical protein
MRDTKLTDFVTFFPAVQKFRVSRQSAGRVFISIGEGGKGSEYVWLTADEAQDLGRYLLAAAQAAKEHEPTAKKKA